MRKLALLYLIWIRFTDLGLKAAHHDEAVNGNFVQKIWQTGRFDYDPANFHGPLLFYLQAISEKIFGFGIESLRFVPVFFSGAWLWFVFKFLEKRFPQSRNFVYVMALSPGLLFFARSAIHETLLMFFMSLGLIAIVEIFQFQNAKAYRWFMWSVVGMVSLKETWVLLAVSGVLAWLAVGAPRKFFVRPQFSIQGLGGDLILAIVLLIFLFSHGATNFSELKSLVTAYLPWMKTGVTGNGHQKPWFYFLQMMAQFEYPLLLFVGGTTVFAVAQWRNLRATPKWILLTAWIHVLIYSSISYKTPWCIVSLLGPLAVASAVLFPAVVRGLVQRLLFQGSIAIALIFNANEFRRMNFTDVSNLKHPYIYVQTRSEVKWLIEDLSADVAQNPDLLNAKFQIAGTEPWPFVWWLENYKNVHYQSLTSGLLADSDIFILDASESAEFEKQINIGEFRKMVFPIRESRENSAYYIRRSRFPRADRYKASEQPVVL